MWGVGLEPDKQFLEPDPPNYDNLGEWMYSCCFSGYCISNSSPP
jgi:hypothetical protein